MPMSRLRRRTIDCSLAGTMTAMLMAAAPLAADTTAVYVDAGSGDRLEIHYRSDSRMLLDGQMGEEPGKLLFLDDRIYAIQGDEYIDLSAMQGMIGGLMQGMVDRESFDPDATEIERTDERRDILGYEGVVYRVTLDGETGTSVMGAHPDLDELVQAFEWLTERMSELSGFEDEMLAAMRDERFRERAPLAFAADDAAFELAVLDRDPIDDAVFSLDGVTPQTMQIPGVSPEAMQDAMKMLEEAMNSPEARDAMRNMMGR